MDLHAKISGKRNLICPSTTSGPKYIAHYVFQNGVGGHFEYYALAELAPTFRKCIGAHLPQVFKSIIKRQEQSGHGFKENDPTDYRISTNDIEIFSPNIKIQDKVKADDNRCRGKVLMASELNSLVPQIMCSTQAGHMA